jgi:hypothetical protein
MDDCAKGCELLLTSGHSVPYFLPQLLGIETLVNMGDFSLREQLFRIRIRDIAGDKDYSLGQRFSYLPNTPV